jgi:transcriptional regulator with XRE-family HTH domain
MSIEDLADKLGKNRTTVYRYENGDIENLPLGILNPLADALNTTPGHLMGWDYKEMISTKISDGEEEAVYSSMNETYVRHVQTWHRMFGMDPFTDEEHEKLIEYGKFLISLRKK